MTTPASGPLSVQSHINPELGRSGTAAFSMNDAAVRTLAGKASGAISFSDLRGKTAGTVSFQTVSAARQYIAGGEGVYYFKAAAAGFVAAPIGQVAAWAIPGGAAGTMPAVTLPDGTKVVAAIPHYQTNGDDYFSVFTDQDTTIARIDYVINGTSGSPVSGGTSTLNKNTAPAGGSQTEFSFAIGGDIDAIGTILTVDWTLTL